jgi:hypothetical protein
MGLSDYNPLEYFKELTLLLRTVFLLAFIVLVIGISGILRLAIFH